MARFNTSAPINKTVNRAGATAYAESPKLELVSILLTSLVQDQYYRSADQGIKELRQLIQKIGDKKFVAKAAIYARDQFNMRSVTHVAAGEVAHNVRGEDWTRRFFENIVVRPDDLLEIMAYYKSTYEPKYPMAMLRGFRSAMEKFDGYRFANYQGADKGITMLDAVRLLHPKANDQNRQALEELIAKGKITGTNKKKQMSALIKAGQSGDSEKVEKAKELVWKEQIPTMGYMALIMNLRNIIEQATQEDFEAALARVCNEENIKKSRLLPFQFMRAYHALGELGSMEGRQAEGAVAKAIDISLSNIPKFSGSTLVAIDHSGSMSSRISDKSVTTLFQTGALFGLALAKTNDADVIYFGDTAKYFNLAPDAGYMSAVEHLDGLNAGYSNSKGYVGHGTNIDAVFEEANRKYDRIVIFSDMQSWRGLGGQNALDKFKTRTGSNPIVYSVDLAGYGTLQFPEANVITLAGFSEKMFDLMRVAEKGPKTIIDAIEKVEL